MSRFQVRGMRTPLVGETRVPGDKSIGHRAVIFAALASGRSRIEGLSGGEDNLRTVHAFRALGIEIEERDGVLLVEGKGLGGLRASIAPIDCGNSGTTMRLLAGVLAGQNFESVLTGDQYLRARPMGRVAAPLRAMGARLEGQTGKRPGDVYPPLSVGGQRDRLHGIDYGSPIASAQVKSAILLAALSAEGRTRVTEPSLSRDHTERMLRAMGAPLVVEKDGAVVVDPTGWDGRLHPRDLVVPGDLSSAAFLLGAALVVPGSRVTVRGVGMNPTRTGALDAMRAMGGSITVENLRDEGGEPVADLTARASALTRTRIDGELAVRAIDEIPLLCALAAHADGETVIADAHELRVKESDRIAAMAKALAVFGVSVEERPDGMVIQGRSGRVRNGGAIESHGDHRIAMASAVCALAGAGDDATIIEDTANVATSFPNFLSSLAALGARIEAA